MNVLIMTDLEGISGVDTIEKVMDVGTAGHRFACERLMADVNAAVDGAIAGGAETVYVIDGHGSANSFIDALLDRRAVKTPRLNDAVAAGKIQAYLQVGAHAMPGTQDGFLDHVQSSARWFEYTINGERYGEIAQGALFTGAFGIPCVMVSGDEAACDEAKRILGGQIATASVKKGLRRNFAALVPLGEAESHIREAARDGVSRATQMPPFTLPLPLTIRLTLMRTDYCDEVIDRRPYARRLDARTVERTVDRIESYDDLLF
ncbi:MAG: M55 family metallopeptidase [Clostridiales bacterium]|jgi:D-amino peptidase|nr:M55 family metallopeptidase [Clostridiales bacterium]